MSSSEGNPRVVGPRGVLPGLEPRPFRLAELAPERAPEDDPARDEGQDGFRLLFYDGRREDPSSRAQRQADQILAEARQEAERLLAEAKDQAEDIRRRAYEEGYAKGHQEGLEAARAKMEAAAEDLARAVRALEAARREVLAGLEGEVIGLVQAVCDKLLLTPGAVDQRAIQEVVRQAMDRLIDLEEVTVRLSRADLARVEEYRPRLAEQFSELGALELVADPELAPGDCLIETPTAKIDARLSTRRQRVYEKLAQVLESAEFHDLVEALEQQRRQQDQPQDQTAETTPQPEADAPPEADAGGDELEEDW